MNMLNRQVRKMNRSWASMALQKKKKIKTCFFQDKKMFNFVRKFFFR